MIRHCKNYTQEELNFIKENYPLKGAKYCAESLDRTIETIRLRASILKLKRIRDRTGKNNPNWKGGIYTENYCIDCGKKISPYEHKRCRQCLYIYQCGKKHPNLKVSGNKNPNWRGGISCEGYPFNFNDELKELIRKRDDYKCQLCGCPQEECIKKLAVHHIDYNKENLNPKNLITLCIKCNSKVNYNRTHWKEVLK